MGLSLGDGERELHTWLSGHELKKQHVVTVGTVFSSCGMMMLLSIYYVVTFGL